MPDTSAPADHEDVASSSSERRMIRSDMIDHIVRENKAYFRSQQINDPDITAEERKTIVENILNEGDKQFLARFGKFITHNHLAYFEEGNNSADQDDRYEINFFLKDIRKSLDNRQRDVKNRRYAAMQRLIDENEYFSEVEMMKREPLLYDHLIGQYMTVNERNLRDALDGPEFSNVLLHGMDVKNTEELRKQQQREEEAEIDSSGDEEEEDGEQEDDSGSLQNDAHKDGIINEEFFPQVPPTFLQHWGDYDDEERAASSSSRVTSKIPTLSERVPAKLETNRPVKPKNHEMRQNYVSADEKDLLREEFFGIMCANFLQGKDSTFDYSKVDDNSEFDDMDIQNQDAEDKYFESDDEESGQKDIRDEKELLSDGEEDELDTYMKNIDKNA